MYNHIAVIAQAADVAQAAEMTPNWTLLGIIFGIMAFIAILLLIPSKEVEALEEEEKKSRPALKFDDLKAIEDKDDKGEIDKSKKSLAEIKVAKRAVVSEEKSKEELRELRKARRAAAQTEKAIQEREVKDAEKSSDVKDVAATDEKERHDGVVEAEKTEEKAHVAEAEASDHGSEILSLSALTGAEIFEMNSLAESHDLSGDSSNADLPPQDSNEVMVDVTADTGDMFATLFGDNTAKNPISLDEIDGGSASKIDDGTIFPTLGSALIPLNEIEKAAEEETEGIDALDELTRRLSDKAEKKTHQ